MTQRPLPFVMIFEHRSGSTYMTEALDSHPDITAHKEYFATLKKRAKKGKEQPGCQLEWAREFFTFPGEALVVGFKTKLHDVLEPEGFADLLRELQVKVILQHRRNRIKLLVSLFNAMRLNELTGDWNLYAEGDRLQPFRIEPDKFEEWLEVTEVRHSKLEAYVEGLGLEFLSVQYEQLMTDREHTLSGVQEFLGVAPASLEGSAIKNTSDDLRDVVLNLDELRSRYLDTKYEAMFDEVLPSRATSSPEL